MGRTTGMAGAAVFVGGVCVRNAGDEDGMGLGRWRSCELIAGGELGSVSIVFSFFSNK